jgi:HNH endonuclease
MDAATRRQVWARADDRCEYCRLRQRHEEDRRFHIEHIIALRHRGQDDLTNLALACALCNLMKGACLSGLDPDGDRLTRLFHPRQDAWEEHFRREGPLIMGLTDVGRTTVWVLDMNCDDRVMLRLALMDLGELD